MEKQIIKKHVAKVELSGTKEYRKKLKAITNSTENFKTSIKMCREEVEQLNKTLQRLAELREELF